MSRDNSNAPKIGAGTASAMLRMGVTELRNVIYPESNVAARQAEPGVWGTATQFEVNQQREADAIQPEAAKESILNERMEQASRRSDPDKGERGHERD